MKTNKKEKVVIDLTPKQIDENVFKLLKIQEEIKELNKSVNKKRKDAEKIKLILESQYKLDASVKEIIQGIETQIEKVPVNTGRNSYDIEILKPFLTAIRKFTPIARPTRVYKLDVKGLNDLVKKGKLPESVLDKARKDKWTFRSQFKRIEKVVQKKDEAINDNDGETKVI